PVFDGLWRTFPHTTLEASGEAVGLPPSQMGNSEVGHLTIGSGRVLDQDLQRVNRAVASGAIFANEVLVGAFGRAKERGGRVDLERDSLVFFNFRPDRARQLTQRLLERGADLTTMTRYRVDFDCPVAFEEQDVEKTTAEVLAGEGIRQLHAAETEKYAHVTY